MSAAGAKKAGRDSSVRTSLGSALYATIKNSKVLMVGAGGIGCELLKNLVLAGFGEIDIVDLDTIDLSNLNRQFLFRHEHIKKSKAMIAKETASKFNPSAKIKAHHGNIKDKMFSVDFFKSFAIVFNALDNLDARRHVNRMCLAADVPLVESGTTGFEGQVQVIKKGSTECYDCNPKPIPKSYPVCTIRSTPSQPIHCIVWAKSYLFTEVFGTDGEEAKDLDTTEDSENAQEINQLKQETRELKEIRENMGNSNFAELVFNKVFDKDIERLRSAEDMWKSRSPPLPLKWEAERSKSSDLVPAQVADQDQLVWNQEQNFAVFVDSLNRLSRRVKNVTNEAMNGSMSGPLVFDKDDKDTLDFVAAAANLRSFIFGIDRKAEFDIKQMAGNIIPAIATTNAATASICVLEAFKVLKDQLKRAKTVFLTPRNASRIISSEPPHPPNHECPVCNVATTSLKVDAARARLRDLVQDILRLRLGYGEELSVSSEQGLVYDPDFEDNLEKRLSDLGIVDGSTIVVVDEEDGEEISDGQYAGKKGPRVNLSIQIKEDSLESSSPPIQAPDNVVITRRPRKPLDATAAEIGTANGNGIDASGNKRKRAGDDDLQGLEPSKKAKQGQDAAVMVDDEPSNGAIVLDD